jgi:ribosomal protein L23
VNIVRLPVKVKRFKGRVGTRSPIKKAYVTLQPGQHIALFEENTSEKK